MFRAMLVKVVALALVLLEMRLLEDPARLVAIVATVGAAIGFFVYVIVSPRAQFLVPSVYRLSRPAADDARGPARVAFTFDDGPDPATTPHVLSLLSEFGAHATFFVVGSRAEAHPDLVRRIVAEGHAVGSHTYRHSLFFHFGSARRMRAEIVRGIDVIAELLGSRPHLFRPPQGLRTPLLRDALSQIGDQVCVTWTERGLDAIGRDADAVVARLSPAIAPGAILVLHDGAGLGGTQDRRPTLTALRELLKVAKERGLSCVTLAELVSRDTAQVKGAP